MNFEDIDVERDENTYYDNELNSENLNDNNDFVEHVEDEDEEETVEKEIDEN